MIKSLFRRKKTPARTIEKRKTTREAFGPPLTAEEQSISLTVLENRLNEGMQCPVGRNQVYIRSLLTGSGTTQPRIALKCKERQSVGLEPEIFYGEIKTICIGNHHACPAWQKVKARFDAL